MAKVARVRWQSDIQLRRPRAPSSSGGGDGSDGVAAGQQAGTVPRPASLAVLPRVEWAFGGRAASARGDNGASVKERSNSTKDGAALSSNTAENAAMSTVPRSPVAAADPCSMCALPAFVACRPAGAGAGMSTGIEALPPEDDGQISPTGAISVRSIETGPRTPPQQVVAAPQNAGSPISSSSGDAPRCLSHAPDDVAPGEGMASGVDLTLNVPRGEASTPPASAVSSTPAPAQPLSPAPRLPPMGSDVASSASPAPSTDTCNANHQSTKCPSVLRHSRSQSKVRGLLLRYAAEQQALQPSLARGSSTSPPPSDEDTNNGTNGEALVTLGVAMDPDARADRRSRWGEGLARMALYESKKQQSVCVCVCVCVLLDCMCALPWKGRVNFGFLP